MSTFKIAFLYLYLLWKIRKLILVLIVFDVVMAIAKLVVGLTGELVNF